MKPKTILVLAALACLCISGCNSDGDKAVSATAERDLSAEAQSFIDAYTATYIDLYAVSGEAQWLANTLIIDGVDRIDNMVNLASEVMSRHTGSVTAIEKTRSFLEQRDQLTPIQVKQLERILYIAADNPQTVPELVKQRIAAETDQVKRLFGFSFAIDGVEVTANEIDEKLISSTTLPERLKTWQASKELGVGLKDGLANLVDLRNRSVQALGYDNYFQYQVSSYGMTNEEMMALMRQFMTELRPLYRQLHTWARYELANRYNQEVPELIPAHWLPNRWGQDWGDLVQVEGNDLDAVLQEKGAEWLVKQAESFYVSLGFESLPASFYEKSSLYPLDKTATYKKNNHASAWHMNLDRDVRSLMSVEANTRWYETTHHELGHIYYYLAYTNPNVPPLLRAGANRAFHEAIGSLLGMASMQKPFLAGLGLADAGPVEEDIQALLKEALQMVVFIPFSAGTMSHFENDLYGGLPEGEYNARWWDYAARFQGIAPPSSRGENYCDAATKTHINDDPAQYYDYAISFILLHQFHAHIAGKILEQNPRQTNYYGNKEVGRFLNGILEQGAVNDWRKIMVENLGEEVSAKPLLSYFAPLTEYLEQQNEGRKHTLPEL